MSHATVAGVAVSTEHWIGGKRVGSRETFADRSPIDSLSDRELEVFEMIGQGLTTRQIATKLDLSPKTVETYRENIKAKLNLPKDQTPQ